MSYQLKIYRTIRTPGFSSWHTSQQNQSHFSSSEMGPLGSRPVFGKCMVPTALWTAENTVLQLPGGPSCTREHRAVFTFFLPAASPLLYFLPVPRLPPAHHFFSSFLPFCCWSLVAFLFCPSNAGPPFSFVRPHFRILGFLWFTGAYMGWIWGYTGGGTQGLMHSKHTLYYQATTPAPIK